MHPHIASLYHSSQKPHRLIIGLMSGTSLDGLDVALCRICGAGTDTRIELLQFETCEYDNDYKAKVRTVFARRDIDLQQLTLLHPWIGEYHGALVNACLARWGVDPHSVDVIASHGQTVFHCPAHQHGLQEFGNATLQLGDGDHLAVETGITTVSDFRQKHIAAGGEGAPLAVYGDYLFFTSTDENRVLLNLGGIANLTWLGKKGDPKDVFSSDLGPGNTLMDAYVQRHFKDLDYDKDSRIAREGKVHGALLAELKNHVFIMRDIPKTTGPEVFNLAYLSAAQNRTDTLGLPHADVLATLNRFTAEVVGEALTTCRNKHGEFALYASGGGIHNPLLTQQVKEFCPWLDKFGTTADLGIDPDAKEAVLFAILANECLAGVGGGFANAREGIPGVTMGKISFPD